MIKHPGQILADDFMTPLGLNASQVSKAIGVHRSTLSRLIAGQHRITPELAACLGAYFQVPAMWWLSMQAEHDAQKIEQAPEWVQNVVPLESNPDFLLTPKGAMFLGALEEAKSGQEKLSVPMQELAKLPQTSKPQPREVVTVHYPSGSVALVGEGT